MSWARIDDNFPQHPKVVQVGAVAAWLYVCGLCYCRKYHTGGFIPAGAVQGLGVSAAGRLIPHLLNAHLWERADQGFQVHDYDAMYADEEDKQRIAATSEARRIAGRKGGLASGDARRSKSGAKPKRSANTQEAKLKPFASSKTEPLKDRNGSDRNGSDCPTEGGPGETIGFYPDQALQILQEAYPEQRVTFGYRTETAWIQELNASGDAATAYATMLTNLEQHKRSYEWRVKKMIPALSKWLAEGLWKRELDEDPPASDKMSTGHRSAPQRKSCGHEPPCLTGSEHTRKTIDEAKALEVGK